MFVISKQMDYNKEDIRDKRKTVYDRVTIPSIRKPLLAEAMYFYYDH